MYQHSWIIPLHLSCWLQTACQVQLHVLGAPITVFDVLYLECQQTYITRLTPWSRVILKKLISHSTGQEIFHMQYSHLSLSLPRNLTTKFCMQLSPRTNLQVQDITISDSKFHYYVHHILCPFSDKVMIYHDSWTGTGPSVSTSMSAWTRRMVGATWTASIQRAATFVPAVTTMCWTQTSIPA